MTPDISELLLDPEDEFLREAVTCISQEGYAMCGTYHLHRLVIPLEEAKLIDHRNRNKLDNRRENLRLTDKRGNALNSKLRADNCLGIKGVRWNSINKKWNAYTVVHGIQMQLYYGIDFFEACCRRKSYEALYD